MIKEVTVMPAIELKDKIVAANFRVKFKDVLDLKMFFKDLQWWVLEYGWADMDEEGEKFETFYLEKDTINPNLKEIWSWWRLRKKDIPEDSYYQYYLDIDWHVTGAYKKEVVVEGQKIKADFCDCEIVVKATIGYDPDKIWKNTPVLKHFARFFKDYLFKKELTEKKRDLYREAFILQAFMKRWLKLNIFLPFEEKAEFYTQRSYSAFQYPPQQ